MTSRRRFNQAGVTYVEASITMVVLVLVVMVAVDVMRVSFYLEAGQYAVNEAARWASFGETLPGAANRTEAVKMKVQQKAGSMGVEINTSQVQVCSMVREDCTTESTLEVGELFILRLQVPFSFISLFGFTKTLLFETIDQNEPY